MPGAIVSKPMHRKWPANTFLGRLDPDLAATAVLLGRPCTFNPGGHLIVQGNDSTSVFLIQDGLAKVTAQPHNGRETLLSIRRDGDVVGELAASDSALRSANVIACRIVVAREVSQERWLSYLVETPEADIALRQTLTERFRTATERRLELGGYPAKVRVARVIIEFARRFGEDTPLGRIITISLSQEEIAAAAGCSGNHARAAITGLKDNGVIAVRYRGLVVTDLAALRRAAEIDQLS